VPALLDYQLVRQPFGKTSKSVRKYFNENKQNNPKNAQKKGAKSAKTDCTPMYRIYFTSTFQIEHLSALGTRDFAMRIRQNFLSGSEQFPHLHTQCFGYIFEGRIRRLPVQMVVQRHPIDAQLIGKLLLRITLFSD
jgi:hypothetical protein